MKSLLQIGFIALLLHFEGNIWAAGVDSTWNNNNDGYWTNNANWSPATFANTGTAYFTNQDINRNITVYVDTTLAENKIIVSNTIAYVFTPTNGGSLAIGNTLSIENDSSGSITFNTDNLIRVADMLIGGVGTGNITNNGVLSDSGPTKAISKYGDFAFIINNSNTFRGGLTLFLGTVEFGNANALGTGALTINGGALQAGGGSRVIGNAVTINSNFVVSGSQKLELSGSVDLSGGGAIPKTITISNTADTIFSGVLSGAGSFTKAGNGTLVIANSNTFTLAVTNNAGLLVVTANSALGTTAGKTVISSGASLGFSNNVNYATIEGVEINGTGTDGAGSIHSYANTNRFAGPVTLTGNSIIGVDAGNMTFSGTTTNGGFLLTANAVGIMTNLGVISGTGGLSKTGAGSLILAGNNTFTGNFTNSAGTTEVSHANALGTSSSYVLSGGTLLYNVGATNTSANVVLSGGTIKEIDQNISLGALTLSANSTIQLNSGGSSGSFRFASGTNSGGSVTLTINGWAGSAGTTGTDDLIFFTSSSFETASFLNNINFTGFGAGATLLSSGELVPLSVAVTPEPITFVTGCLLSLLFSKQLLRRNRKKNQLD